MGEFAKKLYQKWWIWPLPLIILQIIQCFIIRDCHNTGGEVSEHILQVVNGRSAISVISKILYAGNVIIWITYIVKRLNKAVEWHLLMMAAATALCIWNILGIGIWWMFNSDLVDDFGKQHNIPENVEYNEPLPSHYSDRVDENGNSLAVDLSDFINPDDSSTWLQIKNGLQGGIYHYSLFIPEAFDDGEIWLECYEVTENAQLSSKSIRESTLRKVTKEDKEKTTEPMRFSIYEGNWGEFYLARFEVWYMDYATKTKRKLTEKIYKVEGWMR